MAAAAILDFGKFAYLTQWIDTLAGNRCLLLKFGENCFIHEEIINIFRNPRWRPAAILDSENFAFLVKFSNFCYAKVYSVQISAKKLNPRVSL